MVRLLARFAFGLVASLAAVFGYAALLSLAVSAGQPRPGNWDDVAGKVEAPPAERS